MTGRCMMGQGTKDQDISCFFFFLGHLDYIKKGLFALWIDCVLSLPFYSIDAYHYRLLFFYFVGFMSRRCDTFR